MRTFGAAFLVGWSSLAHAAEISVDSTADTLIAGDGACTLREAIINANTDSDTTGGDCAAGVDADVIVIPPGTYVGNEPLDGDTTLRGAGATATNIVGRNTIVGLGAPVFVRDGYYTVLERLSVADWPGFTAVVGNDGVLDIIDSVISGNGHCGQAPFSSNYSCWGGIGSSGTVRVIRSAVVDNAGPGVTAGGLYVENSTISGNRAVGDWVYMGPGYSDPWVCVAGSSAVEAYDGTILNSSIANSSRAGCGSVQFAVRGSFNIKNSLIANPALPNCLGTNTSGGHNLDSDDTCGLRDATDRSNVDPLLGPLADNGGSTPTHALLPGSPALNTIPVMDCTWDDDGDPGTPEVPLPTDQRGARRPQGAGCDIGAFEATACSDGLDNDGDGYTDYPADPGCRNGTSTLERTQCQDGLNNDYSAGIDFDGGASVNGGVPISTADPQCVGMPWRNSEATATRCGLGFEAALALLPLFLAKRRRERTRAPKS